jgi:hypothetical protein
MLGSWYRRFINSLKKLQDAVSAEDVKFKKTKRIYDSTLQKYEMALSKHSLVSKKKEACSLIEDAYILFYVRNEYLKASLDLVEAFNSFNFLSKRYVPYEIMMALTPEIHVHNATGENDIVKSDIVKNLEMAMNKEIEIIDSGVLIKARGKVELDTQTKNTPDNSSECKISDDISLEFYNSTIIEKEGYLFKRKPSLGQQWARRYCKVKEVIFHKKTNITGGFLSY